MQSPLTISTCLLGLLALASAAYTGDGTAYSGERASGGQAGVASGAGGLAVMALRPSARQASQTGLETFECGCLRVQCQGVGRSQSSSRCPPPPRLDAAWPALWLTATVGVKRVLCMLAGLSVVRISLNRPTTCPAPPAAPGDKDATGFNACGFGKLDSQWERMYGELAAGA